MPTDLLLNDLATVIIPARNEESAIIRCLTSIENQGVDQLRVLVVDGVSDDNTVEAIETFASTSNLDITVLTNPKRTIPDALNLGVAHVTTPFIIRMDAHAQMQHGYVASCVAALLTGEWSGVGGAKTPVGATRFGRAAAVAFATKLGSGGSYYHHGEECRPVEHIPFGAYPTYIIRALEGWDPALLVNQDYEFDHRIGKLGGQLLFDPAIRARWSCRNTVRALAYQYFRYGRGKAVVARKHPDSVRLRQLAPPLLPVAAVAGVLAGIGLGSVAIALAVPVIHLLLVASIGAWEASRHPDASLSDVVLAPVAIWVMHWCWGIGILRGVPGGWKTADPFHGNPTTLAGEDVSSITSVESVS